ncbi:MAG TPA: Lrp/AsnC family transcriptional regulator [Candidatus Saccharimonadia bacterium]|nr:Lrp/AsnC family transcriptional regulator [Candidatus Saccharimonadia bacterium]
MCGSRIHAPVFVRISLLARTASATVGQMAGSRRDTVDTGAPGTDGVGELDRRIIEFLQRDGRRPFTQIAAELGVSEAAVRSRTNRLIERGVLQVVGVADPLKMGYHQMAMIGVRCAGEHLMAAAEAIARLPEVIYVVATAGAYDLLVEAVCEDSDALLAFLTERLGRVEGVRTTETFIYLRIVKQSYQWGNH